ncbi:MAG: hypothetical protein M1819_002279 [Sarea resinae]|nr:MAG: hypothetical protein M1819_002279 [Sarea resinae]
MSHNNISVAIDTTPENDWVEKPEVQSSDTTSITPTEEPIPFRKRPSNKTSGSLSETMVSLMKDDQYTDFTIYVGPENIKLRSHYAIWSLRTDFFERAKQGWKEGQENVFRFEHLDPLAFFRAMQFVYLGDYAVSPQLYGRTDEEMFATSFPGIPFDDPATDSHSREIFRNIAVQNVADYLQMADLDGLAAEKFRAAFQQPYAYEILPAVVRDVFTTPTTGCAASSSKRSPRRSTSSTTAATSATA